MKIHVAYKKMVYKANLYISIIYCVIVRLTYRPESEKIFCVGRNKTGTTSIKAVFEGLGFDVAPQREAEILTDNYYFCGNFIPIINYCKKHQAFQDVPFSYPEVYKLLALAFPRSKYILTVRDNSEQWYSSITRFHAKRFGGGHVPTVGDLKAARYVRKGYMYNIVRVHGTPDNDPYNFEIMTAHYESYNDAVRRYFSSGKSSFLEINISSSEAFSQFSRFLGLETDITEFPWKNKT